MRRTYNSIRNGLVVDPFSGKESETQQGDSNGNWIQNQFEVSWSQEVSTGFQLGGGWKKGHAFYLDFGSYVKHDSKFTNKGNTAAEYKPGEKTSAGFGFAQKYIGVDYKRQSYQGSTEISFLLADLASCS